jgi:hypothetical protein
MLSHEYFEEKAKAILGDLEGYLTLMKNIIATMEAEIALNPS